MTSAPDYVPGHGLLAGKVAVVTAAAGTGIGGACARRMLEEGAKVLVSDVHERRLGESVTALAKEFDSGVVHGTPCDVTQEDEVQRLFDTAEERFGPVDVLVNNAGLGGTAKLTEMTDEQWSRVLDVTLNGTMRCTRAALVRMQRAGRGAIVNNASVIGWRAQEGQS